MNTLFRSLIGSVSFVLLTTAPLHALSSAQTYEVRMDDLLVGTLSFRGLVVDDGYDHCRYTGRWTGPSGPLTLTKRCSLDEYKAGDFVDCEQNRRTFFNTVVAVSDCGCTGFDEFGQHTPIPLLIAGEGLNGHLHGIVMSASIGDVEGLELVPRSPMFQQTGAAQDPSQLAQRAQRSVTAARLKVGG